MADDAAETPIAETQVLDVPLELPAPDPGVVGRAKARELIRRGYLHDEISDALVSSLGCDPRTASSWIDEVLTDLSKTNVDTFKNRDANLAIHLERLNMVFRRAMDEFLAEEEPISGKKVAKYNAADRARYLKLALETLDRIAQVQRLVGPKNVVGVNLNFAGGGAAGTTGPLPLERRTQSELIEEARRRGLPLPADLDLQQLAVEAGQNGDTLILDAADARRLEEGRLK
ncbi:MAG: hypothetical protein IT428_03910 [Planctomycetaceae bacterium]|nr:hypothetical protein [Planctomycetaceae bacterium]